MDMSYIQDLLVAPPFQALGWALIHFVWQGALVALDPLPNRPESKCSPQHRVRPWAHRTVFALPCNEAGTAVLSVMLRWISGGFRSRLSPGTAGGLLRSSLS